MKKIILLLLLSAVCTVSFCQEDKKEFKDAIQKESLTETKFIYHVDLKKEPLSQQELDDKFLKLVKKFDEYHFDFTVDKKEILLHVNINDYKERETAYMLFEGFGLTNK